jgi:hypothetical protein
MNQIERHVLRNLRGVVQAQDRNTIMKFETLLSMWKEFTHVRDKYWVEVEKINKRFKKLKDPKIKSIKLIYGFFGEIIGIEMVDNDGHEHMFNGADLEEITGDK